MNNSVTAAALPIWKITQDPVTGNPPDCIPWRDACNPRFSIYDTSGDNTEDPGTWVDDVILDKETGLVWERSPDTGERDWYSSCEHCWNLNRGNRKGWHLPSIVELNSLVDKHATDFLPQCHPFDVTSPGYYWSSTSRLGYEETQAMYVEFAVLGNNMNNTKDSSRQMRAWCVRGNSQVK